MKIGNLKEILLIKLNECLLIVVGFKEYFDEFIYIGAC